METSLYSHELTDGSFVYGVQFIDGDHLVVIHALSLEDAEKLQFALSRSACFPTVVHKYQD